MHIGVLTGGGDCPGLNAVIRAATLAAIEAGYEVWGIRHGYRGLLEDGEEGLVKLDRDHVRGIGATLDELVIKSCFDFFDEGQSAWAMPQR